MGFEIKYEGVVSSYHEEDEITDIVIPKGIKLIAEGAFFFRKNITSVKIPYGVKQIGRVAFSNCESLKSVTLPKSLTYIGEEAFAYCKSLESITIPDSVTNIERMTFFYCKNLKSITIPDSVTSIGIGAFDGTKWLEDYPDDFVIINMILVKYKGNDVNINIPDSVDSVARWAFGECERLETVSFKNIRLNLKDISESDTIIYDVLDMIGNEDFSVKMAHSVKYGILCDMYLADYSSEIFDAYFKKNFTKIFKFAIEKGNVELVKKIVDNKKLLTKRNINNFIEYAHEKGQSEIYGILTKYKNENLA